MPEAAFVLWWIALIAAVVLVLPVMLYLLNRVFQSANDIRIYSAEILAAAHGIANNLEGARELEATPALALRVRDAASALVSEARKIEPLAGKEEG